MPWQVRCVVVDKSVSVALSADRDDASTLTWLEPIRNIDTHRPRSRFPPLFLFAPWSGRA